jgi:hypothetical protein
MIYAILTNEMQFYGIFGKALHLLVEFLETMMQDEGASSKDCRPIAPHTPPTLPAIGRQHPNPEVLANPPRFPPYGRTITIRISPMRARIYQPARTAMQAGTAKTKTWMLDFVPAAARSLDPLMGWTSSDDMNSQVRLQFDTREAAEAYAKAYGIDYSVAEAKGRKVNIRPGGYGDNFATNRRGVWTH